MSIITNKLCAERCVVAAMILDRQCAVMANERLCATDFSDENCGTLFRILCVMLVSGTHIDLVNLRNELYRRNLLDAVGGIEFAVDLVEGLPSIANCDEYIQMVKGDGGGAHQSESSYRRGVQHGIGLCARLASEANAPLPIAYLDRLTNLAGEMRCDTNAHPGLIDELYLKMQGK